MAALVTVLTAASAFAQSPAAQSPGPPAASSPAPTGSADVSGSDILDEIALTRSAIQVRRQAIVTAVMDLTAAESQTFWPLYRDYRTDMAKVNDRLVNLIIVYAANYDSLSDELASQILGDYLDIESARLAVKNRYIPRFQQVLPARKVTRFFQIDNKLDTKIQSELAAEIPLGR